MVKMCKLNELEILIILKKINLTPHKKPLTKR